MKGFLDTLLLLAVLGLLAGILVAAAEHDARLARQQTRRDEDER